MGRVSDGLTGGFLFLWLTLGPYQPKIYHLTVCFFVFFGIFGMVRGYTRRTHREHTEKGKIVAPECGRVAREVGTGSSVGDVWRPAVVNSSTINAGENTSLHK